MPDLWINPVEVVVPENLVNTLNGSILTAETLVRRGKSHPQEALAFVNWEHYSPTPASEFPELCKAIDRINQAIENQETILVWGDFDVDGQTSTTILVEALRCFGADVRYHIPLRASEGHGIGVEKLKDIVLNTPDSIKLLITCDTGISEIDALLTANSLGLDVIITDHHEIPKELPNAHSIINPKLLKDNHPFASLPGVGVVYKLVEALYSCERFIQKKDHHSPDTEYPSIENYLDLVALGIIADVAELRGDTRYLLQRGLHVLRKTQRIGLQELMAAAKISASQLDETHIGFSIAPRLNALGRLADANPIVEFLTTNNRVKARTFVNQLEGINERRKLLTEQITQGVNAKILKMQSLLDHEVLVLSHPGWHTGVIGIVASRLVDQYKKPVILLSLGEDDIAKGSARSIAGVHITDAIATQKNLLIGYGGHRAAAGLAIRAADIPSFRQGVYKAVRLQVGDKKLETPVQIDSFMPLSKLTTELANEIRQLAPFGEGNPPLIFVSENLHLVSCTKIGRRKNHLRLVVGDNFGNFQEFLWWNGVGEPIPDYETFFDLAYTIHLSTYRGEQQLQVQWVDFKYQNRDLSDQKSETYTTDIVDFRGKQKIQKILKEIIEENNVQIWAEGEDKAKLGGFTRFELAESTPLVVWTTPPSSSVWSETIERIKPDKIYLFGINPNLDDPNKFLTRIAGMVKFLLSTKDRIGNYSDLATSTSHQEKTIHQGLEWLESKGYFTFKQQDHTTFWVEKGDSVEKENLPEVERILKQMLDETAAYREYFSSKKKFC